MKIFRSKRGQSFIEYTAVIVCLIAALMAMQFYIKRALQGRLRESADQIGEQYEPGKATGGFTTRVNRRVSSKLETDLAVTIEGKEGYATLSTDTIHEDRTERTGTETMGPYGTTLWD